LACSHRHAAIIKAKVRVSREKKLRPLLIGTRGSRLALAQANQVAELLRPLMGPRAVTLVEVQTAGDQRSDAPLSQIGGEGIFTKEIQRSLLAGAVDVAVHSLKDLPTAPVEGLVLAAVPPRGPVEDVLVSRDQRRFDDLPTDARIGTGSLRRRAQALHRRPDLQVIDIRGNVETRLRKLADGHVDALVLARAGLERLGLQGVITESLSLEWMLPAVGQGALGLECRANDRETSECVKQLDHPATHQAVTAERALLAAVGGGCLVPLGVANDVRGNALSLRAVVLDSEGKRRIEAEVAGALSDAETLGRTLADRLLSQGARRLLGI
jgi:hydroxymethylbilane synthase